MKANTNNSYLMESNKSSMLFSSEKKGGGAAIRCWREQVVQSLFGLEVHLSRGSQFQAKLNSWSLGEVRISNLFLSKQAVNPCKAHSKNSLLNNVVFLKFVKEGTVVIEQSGNTILAEKGTILLMDPQLDFYESFLDVTNIILLCLPKSALEARGFFYSLESPVVYPGDAPESKMLWDFVNSADRESGRMEPDQQVYIGKQFLDWVGIMHALVVPEGFLPTRTTQITLQRIKYYIQKNMHDSRLNVDVIASNMKLSSGYINRLFNSEGTSTMHFVKNSRLEKAKYLLGKNGANNKSVSEVAWLCGFSQVAHFSRSFRSRFCQSPSEYRHTERLDSVVMKNAH